MSVLFDKAVELKRSVGAFSHVMESVITISSVPNYHTELGMQRMQNISQKNLARVKGG